MFVSTASKAEFQRKFAQTILALFWCELSQECFQPSTPIT